MKNIKYLIQDFRMVKMGGIVDTSHDQFYLQCLIEGMRKLQQLEMMETAVKSVRIPVDRTNPNHQVANLPSDYYDFIRIGICVNGIFINFDKNDALCMDYEVCPCANESEITSIVNNILNSQDNGYPTWWYPLWGQPYSYSYTIGSYGIGPGFYRGGYKLDLAKRQIILDHYVHAEEIVLEYTGGFLDNMGDALVPETMVEVLLNFVDWKRCEAAIDNNIYRRAPSKYSQWYQSVRDLNSKNQKLNFAQWVQLLRSFTYLGIKA